MSIIEKNAKIVKLVLLNSTLSLCQNAPNNANAPNSDTFITSSFSVYNKHPLISITRGVGKGGGNGDMSPGDMPPPS